MDSWVVPLVVGTAGAIATLAVGFLTYRQSRKDVRDNLKRDIELFNQMPADWGSRADLKSYVELRTRRLMVDELAGRDWRQLWLVIVASWIPMVLVILGLRDASSVVRWSACGGLIVAAIAVYLFVHWIREYYRDTAKLEIEISRKRVHLDRLKERIDQAEGEGQQPAP